MDQTPNEISQPESADYLVLDEQFTRQYTVVFEGSKFSDSNKGLIIPVKSRKEVEMLLLSLGAEVSVFMDEEARKLYPDIWEWLSGRTYSEVLANIKWSCREEDEVFNLIPKIPISTTLSDSFLKLNPDDPNPEPIDQGYVHKANKDNVMISKPYQCGNMFYFNGFKNSSEINIDYSSDYLEELFIYEVTRQASIAATHLAGLPVSGTLVILKTRIFYSDNVESDKPYLIRTIPVYKLRGGLCYCVYHLIQNERSCTTGYYTALSHKNRDEYKKLRNKTASSD